MNFFELIHQAANQTNDVQVSNEDLDKIIQAAELSPCSMFTLHWQQVVQIAKQGKRANEPAPPPAPAPAAPGFDKIDAVIELTKAQAELRHAVTHLACHDNLVIVANVSKAVESVANRLELLSKVLKGE